MPRGRPKGSKNRKTIEQEISKKVIQPDLMVKKSPAPEVLKVKLPEVKLYHDVLCIGGHLAGKIIKGTVATKFYEGYIMREIKRHNPELMQAAPEPIWVYVLDTEKRSTTEILLEQYVSGLTKQK